MFILVAPLTQMSKIGMSATFGICRGVRRDGAPCSMVINRSVSNYCEYHAPAALREIKQRTASSSRTTSTTTTTQSTLDGTFAAPTKLRALRASADSMPNGANVLELRS